MTERPSLLDVMAIVAASLDRPVDLETTRQHIAMAARDAVAGADYASLTLRDKRSGTIFTGASTDPILYEIDRFQYEFGEGPCFEAVTEEDLSIAIDLEVESRWPRFGPRAAALGIHSQLGIRLRSDKDCVAGLNLYARDPDVFREPLDDVRMVAAQARTILGYAQANEHLAVGMASRTVIGEAIGIVMERYDLDEERAFQFLVRVSQDSNVKLREVAEHIVRERRGAEH